MSDAREAAERLRDMVGATSIDFENASVECVRDMWTLAERYLIEHPADEGEEIDEAWLKEMEYEQNGEFWDLVVPNIAGYPTKVSLLKSDSEWTVFLIQSNWIDDSYEADWGDSACVQLKRITTRGQLRQLISALGVSTKG